MSLINKKNNRPFSACDCLKEHHLKFILDYKSNFREMIERLSENGLQTQHMLFLETET